MIHGVFGVSFVHARLTPNTPTVVFRSVVSDVATLAPRKVVAPQFEFSPVMTPRSDGFGQHIDVY